VEGTSEFTVSPGFAESGEELFAGEEDAEVESSAFLALLPFRGNFLENPTGTRRRINNRSHRLRVNNRMMKLDLHECLDQNGAVKTLNVGSSGMIPSPSACFPKKAVFQFVRSPNGGHYICAFHVTRFFFPPIPLVAKGLEGLSFGLGGTQSGLPVGHPGCAVAI
jgi:hypothetical protein